MQNYGLCAYCSKPFWGLCKKCLQAVVEIAAIPTATVIHTYAGTFFCQTACIRALKNGT